MRARIDDHGGVEELEAHWTSQHSVHIANLPIHYYKGSSLSVETKREKEKGEVGGEEDEEG